MKDKSKGGEYFMMKAKSEKQEIKLRESGSLKKNKATKKAGLT